MHRIWQWNTDKVRQHLITTRMVIVGQQVANVNQGEEKLETLFAIDGNGKQYSHFGNNVDIPQENYGKN